MGNRSFTGKQRYPAFQGRLIYDTWRGQQRVRSWPRKRGPSGTPQQIQQRQWFKAANALAKKVAPSQMATAIEATRNTGLYPRDIIVRAMGAGLIDIIEPGNHLVQYRQDRIDPVAFQGAILELAAPIAIPINTVIILTWPLPVIDTASFWDVSAPTRLVVPFGVTVCEVSIRSFQAFSGNGQMIVLMYKNGASLGRSGFNANAHHGESWSSGPLSVAEGDYFEFGLYMTYSGGSAAAGGLTAFCINVLGTV